MFDQHVQKVKYTPAPTVSFKTAAHPGERPLLAVDGAGFTNPVFAGATGTKHARPIELLFSANGCNSISTIPTCMQAMAQKIIDQARSAFPSTQPHLVAHSVGAAAALRAAVDAPEQFASVTLVEPLSLHLLRNPSLRDRRLFGEIAILYNRIAGLVASDDLYAAAAHYCDFWHGRRSWTLLSDRRRLDIIQRLPALVRSVWAAMQDPLRASDLAQLQTPLLVLEGGRSPGPCRRIAELIGTHARTALVATIADAGHTLPASHGDLAGRYIARHVAVVDSLEPRAA